jgi:hypothetical protein
MYPYRVHYTFQGKPTSLVLDASSSDEALSKLKEQHPQIKTAYLAERVYASKAVREELVFTWTPAVASFIQEILQSDATFYIEGNRDVSKQIEDKYADLTGEVLVPESGVYNIAPDEKWGVEGSLYFDKTISFPEDFGVEPEKPGQVNSTKLFWTLIRLGFRINGNHNASQVLNSIPSEFTRVAGVA